MQGCIEGWRWRRGPCWVTCQFSLFQTLDAFAALACVEVLKGDILKPNPKAWLQMVKNLSVPLELVCSSEYLPDCGIKTRAVVQEVR